MKTKEKIFFENINKDQWNKITERLKVDILFSITYCMEKYANQFKLKKGSGIELIAIERQEQIDKHGYDCTSDSYNDEKQLSIAAILLLMENKMSHYGKPKNWDDLLWNKMVTKSYKERLVIAGALIAAELDRINNYGK